MCFDSSGLGSPEQVVRPIIWANQQIALFAETHALSILVPDTSVEVHTFPPDWGAAHGERLCPVPVKEKRSLDSPGMPCGQVFQPPGIIREL